MRTITVSNSVTLDGVMQAPGRPDEDRRGGFEHGGWANPYFDPVMIESAGVEMGRGTEMLFGRRTYDDFAARLAEHARGQPVHEGPQRRPEARRLEQPVGAAGVEQLQRSSRQRPRTASGRSRPGTDRTS